MSMSAIYLLVDPTLSGRLVDSRLHLLTRTSLLRYIAIISIVRGYAVQMHVCVCTCSVIST